MIVVVNGVLSKEVELGFLGFQSALVQKNYLGSCEKYKEWVLGMLSESDNRHVFY